jgi:hypothetical protein
VDVSVSLQGIRFEWNERKAAATLKRRGVAFETACEVFFDPLVAFLGSQIVDREERNSVIGMTTQWRLLVVAYTTRGETIRIISVREPTRAERKDYEDR